MQTYDIKITGHGTREEILKSLLVLAEQLATLENIAGDHGDLTLLAEVNEAK